MSRSPQEELVHFLSDLYSMELQALTQMKAAPDLAGDESLAAAFRTHHTETEGQVEKVRERLEALGGSSSAIKEAIMKLGGKGFLLFAKLQPETPGRLVAHAYSYEAMEWAGYAVLIRMAEVANDPVTAEVGRSIQAEERTMMQRLERGFGAAEEASHRKTEAKELSSHVCKHLAEAHALEVQSTELMEKAASVASDDPELSQIYAEHLEETRRQTSLIEQRIDVLGGDNSMVEDASLRLGGLNWGHFFKAQSDTPAKLAAFAYAVEHLEIAGYELLRRTAIRAGDAETERLCERILIEEHAMAERITKSLDLSVRATLEALRD